MNIFDSVKMAAIPQSRFDLSHDVKMSFNMGELVPTCCIEALPGDKFDLSVENMLRFAPLIAPVMHKVNVTTHYFFVPNRLLWPDWGKWITGELEVEAPYVRLDPGHQYGTGSLQDYLGYPTDAPVVNTRISPMPIAAYYLIYDEYYRDQNLIGSVFNPLVAGLNAVYEGEFECKQRAWMHDYFTSALPFSQKGAAVQIPLVDQGTIPVIPNPDDNSLPPVKVITQPDGGNPSTGTIQNTASDTLADAGAGPINFDFQGNQVVDIQSDATDINTLRRAFRLQEWLEKNARGGTRYVESILSHFGIKSSDARLQRPEYIGGSKQNMIISEVLATAQSDNNPADATIPVGNMAGHGISVGGGNHFSYRCEEHGYIIGIINVQPMTAYQQGLHRSLTRFNRLDFAWPTFANLGEQPVLAKELYYPTALPERTFGYVPRYAEYKYMNSRVAADFKGSLSFWHLGRIFDTEPELNEEFINCVPDTRIFAVQGADITDHIYSHIFNRISVRRKLPRYGIPSI